MHFIVWVKSSSTNPSDDFMKSNCGKKISYWDCSRKVALKLWTRVQRANSLRDGGKETPGVQASTAVHLESHAFCHLGSWNLSKNLFLQKPPNKKNKLKSTIIIHIYVRWIIYDSHSESLGFRLVITEMSPYLL